MRGSALLALFTVLGFAGGIATACALGLAGPRMRADVILDVTTDQIPRRTHVRANLDHWEPGSETGHHEHPGPVVFVMLEGDLVEVFADGRTRALKTGQAYWKPPREAHNVRNATSRPARALAVHLDPAR